MDGYKCCVLFGKSTNATSLSVMESRLGEKGTSGINSEKRFSEEIGITGWFQPVYLIGLITGFYPGCLYSIVYILRWLSCNCSEIDIKSRKSETVIS